MMAGAARIVVSLRQPSQARNVTRARPGDELCSAASTTWPGELRDQVPYRIGAVRVARVESFPRGDDDVLTDPVAAEVGHGGGVGAVRARDQSCIRGGTTRRARWWSRCRPLRRRGTSSPAPRGASMALSQSRIVTDPSGRPGRSRVQVGVARAPTDAGRDRPVRPAGRRPPPGARAGARCSGSTSPIACRAPRRQRSSRASPGRRLLRPKRDRCVVDQTDNLSHRLERTRRLRRLEPVAAWPERPHDDRAAVHPGDRLVVQRARRRQDLAASERRESSTHGGAGF